MNLFKTIKSAFYAAFVGGTLLVSAPDRAEAQADPFIGQLMLFGGNFCPRSWAAADGSLLPISSNSALFSLLGAEFGGDGRTTFGLPDLRGRVPINVGTGPGLPTYQIGQKGGSPTHTLNVTEMPQHNHMLNGVNSANGFSDRTAPGTDYLGVPNYNAPNSGQDELAIYHDGPPNVQMDAGAISMTGGSQPFSTQSPYIAMTWCIALQGIYPSRS